MGPRRRVRRWNARAAHGPRRHYAELTAGDRALRFWEGRVAGHALEGVDLLTFRLTGEVAEALRARGGG